MMHWCHECGEWRDVDRPIYMCSACIEEWGASYVERRSKKGPHR
jgi:hypothetical protein